VGDIEREEVEPVKVDPQAAEPEVRAAGAAVWRLAEHQGGVFQVLVIHRPRYDDWSLPKGKREPGEDDDECARREVTEETGVVAPLGRELDPVGYTDRRGRSKLVRYWSMEVPAGAYPAEDFVPNEEVDEIRWLAPAAARDLLSYPHDRDLVEQLRTVTD